MAFRGEPTPEQHHDILKTHAGNAAKLQDESCLSTHVPCTGSVREPRVTDKAPTAFSLWLPPLCVSVLSQGGSCRKLLVCNCLDTCLVQPQVGSSAGSERWAQHTHRRDRNGVGAASGSAGTKGICRSHPSLQVPLAAADGRAVSCKHKQGGRHRLPVPWPAGSPRVCFAVLRLLFTNSAGQSITTAFLFLLLPRAFCGP